ncbi:MAG: sensor histidine kinase, partial [Pseudobdellovibrionaceae bacterium]
MIKKRHHYKTILAVMWFLFTFSLVTWWWIYGLHQVSIYYPTDFQKKYSMLLWEGFFLLVTLFAGGAALIFFTWQDQRRHEKLKLFFSTFTHDLKTSISRLR